MVALTVTPIKEDLTINGLAVNVVAPKDGGIETVPHTTTVTGVLTPCSVKFYADVSGTTFDTKDGYDPITGETFTNVWKSKDHEIEYFWNNGEDIAEYWPEVGPVIYTHHSRKSPLRGRVAEHTYTEPGTYNWTLMAIEPSSGKVAFASGTIVVESCFAAANRIVVLRHNSSDFSAFDSSGLTATIFNVNLAGTQFTESHAAYTDHAGFDNVVWAFEGYDENGDIFDFNLIVDGSTAGHSHVVTSYGAGRWRTDVVNNEKVLQIQGNGDALEPKPFRLENLHIVGSFDNTDTMPADPAPYCIVVSSPNWWFINHNVKSSNWGSGGGTWQDGVGTDVILSLAGCVMADTGGEYSILVTGDASSELLISGCFFYDQWDRWSPGSGDNKNSMVRHSGPYLMLISKSRIFVMRRGAGQTSMKIGNGSVVMDYSHVYFCTLEGSNFSTGIYPVANTTFQEVNCIIECCLMFGNPWTATHLQAQAEGWTFRYNSVVHDKWPFDETQGDNGRRLRHLVSVGYALSPAAYFVGAPNRVYGNTIVSDLTLVQNNGQPFGPMIHAPAPASGWDGYTPDEYDVASWEDQNFIYTPNMPGGVDDWTVGGPVDYESTSVAGGVGTTGQPISPMFKGWRATSGGAVDTDLDQSGGNAPSFIPGASSIYFRESAARPRKFVSDNLGRLRGPRSSRGAMEANDYVVEPRLEPVS